MQAGRIVIYTGAKEITSDNIIPILREAILEHDINSNRIQFLLDYDAGIQPIVRKNPKTYRPDIDCYYYYSAVMYFALISSNLPDSFKLANAVFTLSNKSVLSFAIQIA